MSITCFRLTYTLLQQQKWQEWSQNEQMWRNIMRTKGSVNKERGLPALDIRAVLTKTVFLCRGRVLFLKGGGPHSKTFIKRKHRAKHETKYSFIGLSPEKILKDRADTEMLSWCTLLFQHAKKDQTLKWWTTEDRLWLHHSLTQQSLHRQPHF